MKCDAYAADLAEYLDDALPPARRRELELHLDGCAACRTLVADLRAIRAAAFTLDRVTPPPAVWERIAAETARTPRRAFGASIAVTTRWLAAAALLVAVVGAGLYSVWRREPPPAVATTAPQDASGDALVASVEADLQAAEAHYEKAIQGLEQIARSENDALDPAVAAVLQKNLQLIDQAIDESRAAVRAQPTSENAQESLFDAMRNKVALLQQTVELINEMRKGNQAEAGRIMQNLGKP